MGGFTSRYNLNTPKSNSFIFIENKTKNKLICIKFSVNCDKPKETLILETNERSILKINVGDVSIYCYNTSHQIISKIHTLHLFNNGSIIKIY